MKLTNVLEALGDNAKKVVTMIARCNNATEIIVLAKENGITINTEEAEEVLKIVSANSAELSDDELDIVAGASGADKNTPCHSEALQYVQKVASTLNVSLLTANDPLTAEEDRGTSK